MSKGVLYICLINFFSLNLLAEETLKKEQEGEKLFRKYLRKSCRTTAINFAQNYTKQEWKTLKEKDLFTSEIYQRCPKVKVKLSKVQQDTLYAFCFMYAKGSGHYAK